jgi:hypothetical protein
VIKPLFEFSRKVREVEDVICSMRKELWVLCEIEGKELWVTEA